MPAKIHSCYDDNELCNDLAKSDLSMAELAVKHKISASLIYQIARGDTRPELKVRIDEILEAGKSAAMRLAKVRARFCVARLVQLAQQDVDKRAAITAVEKLLDMAGMLNEGGATEKQAIEIILSAGNGNGDPLKRNLSGVYRPGGN